MRDEQFQAWPELPYDQFKLSAHLLHMSLQAIGKLKLMTPYEPHWANVPFWLTTHGVTTGIIPYQQMSFSVSLDFLKHVVVCSNSLGNMERFPMQSTSVANFVATLFATLKKIGVDAKINMMPQEITKPIPFNEDTTLREYNPQIINAWWQILLSSHHVLQKYHARFSGTSPAVGLMWGTLDLRDARYIEKPVPTTGINASFIRRNAMDVAQVEAGWWGGNDAYPRAAYYSFTYPQPSAIEQAKIKPAAAKWNATLGQFLLDYDDIRTAKQPEQEIFAFLESAYQTGTSLAGWSTKLIGKGEPA